MIWARSNPPSLEVQVLDARRQAQLRGLEPVPHAWVLQCRNLLIHDQTEVLLQGEGRQFWIGDLCLEGLGHDVKPHGVEFVGRFSKSFFLPLEFAVQIFVRPWLWSAVVWLVFPGGGTNRVPSEGNLCYQATSSPQDGVRE